MSSEKKFTAFSFAKTVQLLFRKLIPLSVIMLSMAEAYANCPRADTILANYVSHGHFVEEQKGSEWKLAFDEGYKPNPNDYKNLRLIMVKVEKAYQSDLNDVKCTYNNAERPAADPQGIVKGDPEKGIPDKDIPQNLHLVAYKKEVFGRKAIGRLTTSSYVVIFENTDLDKTKWDRSNLGSTTVFCFLSEDECGGFMFVDNEKDEQPNGYWQQAYNGCRPRWDRCNGVLGNFPKEMRELAVDKCKEVKCEDEIKAMNMKVEEMAEYVSFCWANTRHVWKWQNKKMPPDDTCRMPEETWPNYSGIVQKE